MRFKQNHILSETLLTQASQIGSALARLRVARGMTQQEAALRSGISRNSAYRLEHGDSGVALGHILRYLDAIAPGTSLLALLQQQDPALHTLAAHERRQRARGLTPSELQALDF